MTDHGESHPYPGTESFSQAAELAPAPGLDSADAPRSEFGSFLSQIAEARESGDPAAVYRAVRAGFIEAVTADRQDYGLIEHHHERLRQYLVAHGLAAEFGQVLAEAATTNPDDVSAVDRHLIELATGQAYGSDFQPRGPLESTPDPPELAPGDWLALAAIQPGSARQADYLRRSVGALASPAAVLQERPVDIAGHIEAAQQFNPDLTSPLLDILRRQRDLPAHHDANLLQTEIDIAMLRFVADGRTELASRLITPSLAEPARIKAAAATFEGAGPDVRTLTIAAAGLHEAKVRELYHGLHRNGVSTSTIQRLQGHANDPESALAVPPGFWQIYDNQHESIQRFITDSPVPVDAVADTILLIARYPAAQDSGVLLLASHLDDAADREQYIHALARAHTTIDQEDLTGNWEALPLFRDAGEALAWSRSLFSQPSGEPPAAGPEIPSAHLLYLALTGTLDTPERPVELDAAQLDFLDRARHALSEIGGGTGELALIGQAVMRDDSPIERREEFLQALHLLRGNPDASTGLGIVVSAARPLETIRVWASEGQAINALPPGQKRYFYDHLSDPSFRPAVFAHRLFSEVIPGLTDMGIPLAHINAKHAFNLAADLAATNVALPPERLADELRSELRIDREIRAGRGFDILRAVDAAITAPPPQSAPPTPMDEPEPDFTQPPAREPKPTRFIDPSRRHPELDRALSKLGVPRLTANEMNASWLTFQALHNYSQMRNKYPRDFTPADTERAIEIDSDAIIGQYQGVRRLVWRYGAEELDKLHQTFQIVNFRRGTPDQWHRQLEHWNNPLIPVRNLVIGGKSNTNYAFDHEASQAFAQLGSFGTFYFEAGSRLGLSNVGRAVGDRERAAGRDPLTRPSTHTVLIATHAMPDGLELGLMLNQDNHIGLAGGYQPFEHLVVADYLDAAAGREKLSGTSERLDVQPNTYQQHLGNQYRLILKACRPGRPLDNRANIADTMMRAHDISEVHASTEAVTGVRVGSSGDVRFIIYDHATGRPLEVPSTVLRSDRSTTG